MISHSVLLRMRRFKARVVEKLRTHILCSIIFFFNLAVYEIMWKNTAEPGRQAACNASALHAGYISGQTHTQNV